jgi:hypothetical protein
LYQDVGEICRLYFQSRRTEKCGRLLHLYQIALRHILEDSNFHIHLSDSLKSHKKHLSSPKHPEDKKCNPSFCLGSDAVVSIQSIPSNTTMIDELKIIWKEAVVTYPGLSGKDYRKPRRISG